MRLNNFINNKYISLKKKEEFNIVSEDKEIKKILKDLNRFLEMYYKMNEYVFGLTDDYVSPTEYLNINDAKLEKITRKWMKCCEKFEEIKDTHKKGLQNK